MTIDMHTLWKLSASSALALQWCSRLCQTTIIAVRQTQSHFSCQYVVCCSLTSPFQLIHRHKAEKHSQDCPGRRHPVHPQCYRASEASSSRSVDQAPLNMQSSHGSEGARTCSRSRVLLRFAYSSASFLASWFPALVEPLAQRRWRASSGAPATARAVNSIWLRDAKAAVPH